jgi:hypothetical protein
MPATGRLDATSLIAIRSHRIEMAPNVPAIDRFTWLTDPPTAT